MVFFRQGFETTGNPSVALTPIFPLSMTTVSAASAATTTTNGNPLSVSSLSSSSSSSTSPTTTLSRYENQKRRDWNTFGQYLCNHRPPLSLSRCSGAHVLEFLRYLDQFGKTKIKFCVCSSMVHIYIHNFLPFLHGCNNGDLYKNPKEQ
ncbi:hypothetical protein PVK06_032773 [Gossypium arboreum]|uniref:ALOG domain-containing protein n=1 Tax=Gossypium arboreum TaxID=29729 RepID=A0ABR0NVY9_GOSAR|nr:hypothetical protein PVK06_032773 [Gossypium arboreum]